MARVDHAFFPLQDALRDNFAGLCAHALQIWHKNLGLLEFDGKHYYKVPNGSPQDFIRKTELIRIEIADYNSFTTIYECLVNQTTLWASNHRGQYSSDCSSLPLPPLSCPSPHTLCLSIRIGLKSVTQLQQYVALC